MKILFAQKTNGISGSELYLLQIIPELRRRGYEVEMLMVYPENTGMNAGFKNLLVDEGIVCHEIYGYSTFSFSLIKKIYQITKERKFDLIQTNLVHADFWFAIIKIFFKRSIKIISVKHGFDPDYQAKYGFDLSYLKFNAFYWIQKLSSIVINYNITISKGLYDVFVLGNITKASKTKLVYYGLTLTPPVENHEPISSDEPYLVIIGRLIEVKGHIHLINSWKIVSQHYPSVKLYIVGDGHLRQQLETEVNDANLQNSIVFLGYCNPHPYIQQSLFTIVTSTWEGFGLIILESWLHKKTVVSFDGPAMNEIIDDAQNGLLVKMNDTDDLAQKIIYLLKNPELADTYGRNGNKKLTSFFTLQRMTDEMENIYKDVNADIYS